MMNKLYHSPITLSALIILLGLAGSLHAQISFTNQNNMLTDSDHHSGVAVAIADMNDDHLDDIVRLSDGEILTVEYQTENGTFTPYMFGNVANQSQWSMCVADVDNNGFGDVMCGDYNTTKIITASPEGNTFSVAQMPGADFFAQASNFADINNDGFLDAFVCNDDAESRIFGNNGDGTFSMADHWIDMTTTPASDNSGNYGSIWTDFDNDGDLDLYIAKCRQGVGDPTDPRRINALFVNDGQNNYSENADEYGLKIGWQSWTADFNDIDNDGDLDVFLTNHDYSNQLLLNDGTGHYTEITETSGMTVTNFPLQGVMRDFDNDGFVDILISGDDDKLLHNNGDNTFTEITGLFDDDQIHSYAIGDLNHDGFLDIYASYANGYTTPNPGKEDIIWINGGNDNNFFAVDLIGIESNRDGVGARIEIYGDWGIQVREIRAGESYGIMNSMTAHFGLGTATSITNVIVKWPSGNVDVIEGPDINQFLTVVEGSCGATGTVDITASGSTVLCPGETVELTAPDGFAEYLWSNGAITQTITVSEGGSYNVVVEDEAGCFAISQNAVISMSPDETPTVEVSGDIVFCVGGEVTLTSSEADEYTWSNGAETQSITVSETGEYFVTIQGACDEFSSAMVMVDVLEADDPDITDVQVAPGETATLMATGDDPQWYNAETGGVLVGTGNTLEVNVSESTSYWVEDRLEYGLPEQNTGMENHQGQGGNSDYSGAQYNSGVVFEVFQPITINSVKVYTDTEADRLIQLINGAGSVIKSKLVTIPATGDEGIRIDLDFDIPVGANFYLTTNELQNQSVFDDPEHNSPRLRRSNTGVDYDAYFVEDVIDITGSTLGQNRYYYFFDWEVKTESEYCYSDRVEAQVIVVGTNDIDKSSEVSIFPNPTNGTLNVWMDFAEAKNLDIRVNDITGKQVYAEDLGVINGTTTHSINLEHLPKGVYLFQLMNGTEAYNGRFIVQ